MFIHLSVMDEKKESTSIIKNLPLERRISFVLLISFAILIVTLVFFRLRNIVYAPFALSDAVPKSLKSELVDNNIDYVKVIDTDKDGLHDYDEMYTYGTSPYLYDTFGYGMSDSEVVKKGLALCPGAGKNCSENPSFTAQSSSTSNFLDTIAAQNGLSSSDLNLATPDLMKMLSDPKQVRSMLLQTGNIDTSTLNKINDKDLLIMVNSLLQSTSTVSVTTSRVR